MNAKKIVTAGLALVMVAGISVAGTLAFLTDTTEQVKNTFTVGNVNIDLFEHKYDKEHNALLTGTENETKANVYETVIPGKTYPKDPTVEIQSGSQKCYVFVKVENDIASFEAAENNISTQMAALKWVEVEAGTGVYVYAPDGTPAEVDASTAANFDGGAAGQLKVFDEFTIAGDISDENYASLGNTETAITITAYAIQSEGLDTDLTPAEIYDLIAE